MQTHATLRLLPSSEQVKLWRQALAEKCQISLTDSAPFSMEGLGNDPQNRDIAELYNWLAMLDHALVEISQFQRH